MSEQNTDIGAQGVPEENDNQAEPAQTVNADQVVVNNAPDGGGVDNPPAEDAEPDTEPDPNSGQEN